VGRGSGRVRLETSDWEPRTVVDVHAVGRVVMPRVLHAGRPPNVLAAAAATGTPSNARPSSAFVVLLSPAKSLNEEQITGKLAVDVTTPRFASRAVSIARLAEKDLNANKIKSLMGVSDAIATLNVKRFKNFQSAETKACVLAFDGPAFKHLRAGEFKDAEDMEYLQQHLRILSGLYGVLRPYDAIAPYRLEMGTKWAPDVKNLYEYWGTDIANAIADDLERQSEQSGTSPFVVNCASQEYFKSVNLKTLQDERNVPVYSINFPGPAVYAKQARGAMVRHCVENKVVNPQDLKSFVGNDGCWSFDEGASSEFTFVFRRNGAKKTANSRPAKKPKSS